MTAARITTTPMQLVEALKSGQFHQAHGQLVKFSGYCCLGVLCEIDPAINLTGDSTIVSEGVQSSWASYIADDLCPDWLNHSLQESLAYVNDRSDDRDDYAAVISYLERHVIPKYLADPRNLIGAEQ